MGAENLCHQAILMNHAADAVTSLGYKVTARLNQLALSLGWACHLPQGLAHLRHRLLRQVTEGGLA